MTTTITAPPPLPTDRAVARAASDRRPFPVRLRSRDAWIVPPLSDPRWLFALIHTTYVVAGHLLLNFNRSPGQIVIALVACAGLEVIYTFAATRMFIVPVSGLISGLGLALLFTAPGNSWLMLFVAWLTITGKYLVTWRGHHVYNPTNLALVIMLVLSGGQVAIAPAYQWGGLWQALVAVFALGLIIAWRAGKLPLVLAFFVTYALGALLRARLTGMPAEITLYAQISGGAFWAFTFSMITDPKTSPPDWRGMIGYGVAIAVVDVWLQLHFAVFSLFYALFLVCTARALWTISLDLARPLASVRVAPPAISG